MPSTYSYRHLSSRLKSSRSEKSERLHLSWFSGFMDVSRLKSFLKPLCLTSERITQNESRKPKNIFWTCYAAQCWTLKLGTCEKNAHRKTIEIGFTSSWRAWIWYQYLGKTGMTILVDMIISPPYPHPSLLVISIHPRLLSDTRDPNLEVLLKKAWLY